MGAPGSVKGKRRSPSPQRLQRGCQTGPSVGTVMASLGHRSMNVAFLFTSSEKPSLVTQPKVTTPHPCCARLPQVLGPVLAMPWAPLGDSLAPPQRLSDPVPAQCQVLCALVGSGRLLEGCVRGQHAFGSSVLFGSQIGRLCCHEAHHADRGVADSGLCQPRQAPGRTWGGSVHQSQGPSRIGERVWWSPCLQRVPQGPLGAAHSAALSLAHVPALAPRAPHADVWPLGLAWRPSHALIYVVLLSGPAFPVCRAGLLCPRGQPQGWCRCQKAAWRAGSGCSEDWLSWARPFSRISSQAGLSLSTTSYPGDASVCGIVAAPVHSV